MNCGAWRIWARSTVSRNIGAPRCGKWRKRLMMICSIAELWGAQAASLLMPVRLGLAAACRKHLRRERVTATGPYGETRDGTGLQPALPIKKIRRFLE